MYCSKCGSEVPEGSKFCGKCGAQILAESKEAPVQQVKKEKKKVPVWLTIGVMLVVFVVGRYLIAPAMLTDTEETEAPESNFTFEVPQAPQISTETETGAPAEDQTEPSYYIATPRAKTYSATDEDGAVYSFTFRYKDEDDSLHKANVVYNLSGTFTNNWPEATEEIHSMLEELCEEMRSVAVEYNISDCSCEYIYEDGECKVEFEVNGLDDESNMDNIIAFVYYMVGYSSTSEMIMAEDLEAFFVESGYELKFTF